MTSSGSGSLSLSYVVVVMLICEFSNTRTARSGCFLPFWDSSSNVMALLSSVMLSHAVKINPLVEFGHTRPRSGISSPPSALPRAPRRIKALGVWFCIAILSRSRTSCTRDSSLSSGADGMVIFNGVFPRNGLEGDSFSCSCSVVGVTVPLLAMAAGFGAGAGGTLRTS